MSPSPFEELRDQLFSAVDDQFAEKVLLAFKHDNQNDPTRANVEISAILRTQEELATPFSGNKDKTWNSVIAGHVSELHIDREAFPDVVLRKGDKVRAISRHNKPWYEVLYVDDRSHRRLIVKLGVA